MSRDMMEFVGFAQQAVYRGMERELALVEKQNAQYKEKVSCTSQNIPNCCGRIININKGLHDQLPEDYYTSSQQVIILVLHINNSLQLARKYAQIFVCGHDLLQEANSFLQA